MDSGDLFFVATDPSEGVPLSDKSFRHAPPWFKLDLLRQVAGALQTLHEFGLLYPSLRTDSIVVVDGSTAKLLDVFEANPSSSVNPYTAPEVAAGAPRSPRSDVFALGVITYELLCDKLPFIGTTEAELAHAILSTHPAPPSSVGVLGMDELIAKSLAKDPDERYESAAEFLAALPALASASPPQPIPPQPAPPAQRPLPELEEPFDIWDDNVQFTVYRPKQVAPERWHDLLVFAHLTEKRPNASPDEPDPVEEVARQAEQFLSSKKNQYHSLTEDSSQSIPLEGDLTISPQLPGININPPTYSFRWQESVHRANFRLKAPQQLAGQTVAGEVCVFLGSILVAEISVRLRITSAAAPAAATPPDQERASASPYRKIFPSYSRKDSAIVEQFERYARGLGDGYMRDVVTLRSGEVWYDRLLELIAEADVFQLFWSTNSMHSRVVQQELQYALSLNRPRFVRPVYWEDPLPEDPGRGLPPPGLRSLHFVSIRQSAPRYSAMLDMGPLVVPPAESARGPTGTPAAPDFSITQQLPFPSGKVSSPKIRDLDIFDSNDVTAGSSQPGSRPPVFIPIAVVTLFLIALFFLVRWFFL